jgi:hypothetical protein
VSTSYSNNKIPFGLKDGNLVAVSEVPRGLACGCVCPACKRRLQANKGDVVAHYFSHDPSGQTTPCESAFETAIHLMAKQLLSEYGSLITPELTVSVKETDIDGNDHVESACVEESGLRSFDKVDLEKRLGEIRPDIIAYIDGKPLLIEIAVTSFVDSKKKKIIRELGLSAIEINLKNLSYAITKDELRNHLCGPKSKIKWISNPRAITIKEQLRSRISQKIRDVNQGIQDSKRRASENIARLPIQRKLAKVDEKNLESKVKEYEVLSFFCKGCRHIFQISNQAQPYLDTSIPCPACNRPVTTTPVGPKPIAKRVRP